MVWPHRNVCYTLLCLILYTGISKDSSGKQDDTVPLTDTSFDSLTSDNASTYDDEDISTDTNTNTSNELSLNATTGSL